MSTAIAIELDAKRIVRAHTAFLEGARTTIERALECGHLLASAKAAKQHGEWIPWLERQREMFGERFPSERTAQAYMRLWNRRLELPNPNSGAVLTGVRQALNLMAAPRDPSPPEVLSAREQREREYEAVITTAEKWAAAGEKVLHDLSNLPYGWPGPAAYDRLIPALGGLVNAAERFATTKEWDRARHAAEVEMKPWTLDTDRKRAMARKAYERLGTALGSLSGYQWLAGDFPIHRALAVLKPDEARDYADNLAETIKVLDQLWIVLDRHAGTALDEQ